MNVPNFIYRLASLIPIEPKRRMYRLEVEAKDIELLTIKDFVQRVCDAAGCGSKETATIKLAIDEACSNIIRHAYQGKQDGKITLEVGISFMDLKIKIIDYGNPFDFRGIKDPDLNHYVDIGKKGGLGIWLIKKVMNRVNYHAYPGRNELTLYRRLSKAPPKELGLKKGNYTISTKFTIGSGVFFSLLVFLAYTFLSSQRETFVLNQQRDKAKVVVNAIASQAGEAVIHKNDLALDKLIREILHNDPDKVLTYVFVTGPEGKYLAHSDLSQLFRPYKAPPGVPPVRSQGIQNFKLKAPDAILTNYTTPIYFHAP